MAPTLKTASMEEYVGGRPVLPIISEWLSKNPLGRGAALARLCKSRSHLEAATLREMNRVETTRREEWAGEAEDESDVQQPDAHTRKKNPRSLFVINFPSAALTNCWIWQLEEFCFHPLVLGVAQQCFL